MSSYLEGQRAKFGHPHAEEVAGRSIASAVHRIDELTAAIAAVRLLHVRLELEPGFSVCTECLRPFPCSTIRALPEAVES